MRPTAPQLRALLADWMQTANGTARTHAQTLLRYRISPRPSNDTVEAEFWDGGRAHLGIRQEAGGAIVFGKCTCALSFRMLCGHQLALARLAELHANDLKATWVDHLALSLERGAPEATLARLDALLAPLTPKRDGSESHLHWVVARSSAGLVAELRQRAPLKGGGFGRSKAVAISRYRPLLEKSSHPQDRLVLRAFGPEFRYNASGILTTRAPDILELLAGHPDVHFGDFPNPMRICVEEMTLRLREDGRELVLEPTLAGHSVSARELNHRGAAVVADERRGRIVIARPSDELISFIAQMPPEGLRLPAELGARVAERLWEIAGEIPVDLPAAFSPSEVPADGGLRVSLSKVHDSWEARLIVRPLAGGPQFPPGEGLQRVTATVDGRWQLTTRALSEERRKAEELVGALGLPFAAPSWSSSLPLDALLDLATALKSHPEVIVEWPEKSPSLLASRARLRVAIEKKRDWFGIEGVAEIDGVEVAIAHLLAAKREKKRYVEIAPNRFLDVAQVFDERLQRLADATRSELGKLALTRAAGPLVPELLEGIEEVQAGTDWAAFAERAASIRSFEPQMPDGLHAELRDYQIAGFRWMRRLAELGLGCCLADDMGLGKTLQAISMLLARASGGPALVLAPTSVVFNWQREVQRFAPDLKVHLLAQSGRDTLVESAGPNDVVIASWGLLRSSNELLSSRTWHTLVLDEAQVIKNWSTDTARATRRLGADWRLALTGTPIENHLGELYSLLETVIPGLFGSWDSFQHRFASPIERHGDPEVRKSLSRLVSPIILRRTKSQVARELPERTELRLDVELSSLERQLYEAARVSAVNLLEKLQDDATGRIQVLAELTRLRQLASSAHLVDPAAPKESSKTKVLLAQLEQLLEEGHAALVFSQFTRQLALVSEALEARGIEHLMLTGETPAPVRERLVDQFQQGKAKVFLISLKAGGTGLNLTAADSVFLLDPWWNPAVEDQAADRAHRIGQKRRVTVLRLVARGTIEEKVIELHEQKRALVSGVLDNADVAARLSTSQLIELMKSSGEKESASEDEDWTPTRVTVDTSVWTHEKVFDRLREAWALQHRADARKTFEGAIRLVFAATHDRPAPLGELLSSAIRDYLPYASMSSPGTRQQRMRALQEAIDTLARLEHLTKEQRKTLRAEASAISA